MFENIPILLCLTDFLIFLGFLVFTFHLWQVFKRKTEKVSEMTFYFSFFLTIAFFFILLQDLFLFPFLAFFYIFFLTLSFSFLGFLIFYLKFPSIPPKYGFLIIFLLGILSLILNIFFPHISQIDPISGKKYIFPHPIVALLLFFMIFISAFPAGIIFIQKGLALPPSSEKIKAYGIGSIIFLGLIAAFFYAFNYFNFITFHQRFFFVAIWIIIIFLVTLIIPKLGKRSKIVRG